MPQRLVFHWMSIIDIRTGVVHASVITRGRGTAAEVTACGHDVSLRAWEWGRRDGEAPLTCFPCLSETSR